MCFNIWIYVWLQSFYTHVFNGCYAVLLFIVVIFFLIYGVEVFFKVSCCTDLPTISIQAGLLMKKSLLFIYLNLTALFCDDSRL
jgi:hypothetical protein